MNNETENEVTLNEEIRSIGTQVEKRIVSGDEVFLTESERYRIRRSLLGSEVAISVVEGKSTLSQQADQVTEALGPERMVEMMKAILSEAIELPSGGVFGKGQEKPDNYQQLVIDFAEKFLREQISKDNFVFNPLDYKEEGKEAGRWKTNTIYRIEAVMSIMNKLMWITAVEDEAEGSRRQSTNGILKHVRERVMRGHERAGERVEDRVQRLPDKDDKRQIIRYLPKGGMSVVLEKMTTM